MEGKDDDEDGNEDQDEDKDVVKGTKIPRENEDGRNVRVKDLLLAPGNVREDRTTLWGEVANTQKIDNCRTRLGRVLPLLDIPSAILINIELNAEDATISASWEHWVLIDFTTSLNEPPPEGNLSLGLTVEDQFQANSSGKKEPTRYTVTFEDSQQRLCRSTLRRQAYREEVSLFP